MSRDTGENAECERSVKPTEGTEREVQKLPDRYIEARIRLMPGNMTGIGEIRNPPLLHTLLLYL